MAIEAVNLVAGGGVGVDGAVVVVAAADGG